MSDDILLSSPGYEPFGAPCARSAKSYKANKAGLPAASPNPKISLKRRSKEGSRRRPFGQHHRRAPFGIEPNLYGFGKAEALFSQQPAQSKEGVSRARGSVDFE